MKKLLIATLSVFLCGCSILGHMDQLLVMGDYARDKNGQGKTVDEINAKYDKLLAVINTGRSKDFPNQAAILNNFGEPIFKKPVTIDGVKLQQWLYRYAIPQKAKDKVYLYFDDKGALIKFEQEKIQWL